MTTFDVLKSPRSDIHQAIKRGFNWPAFFFPLVWAVVYRIPRRGYNGYMSFASLCCSALLIGMAGNLLSSGPPLIVTLFSFGASCGAGIIGGANGNNWHVRRLEDDKWQLVGAEEAKSAYDAIQAVRNSASIAD